MTNWTPAARAAAVADAEVRHGIRPVALAAAPKVTTGETGYSGVQSWNGSVTFGSQTEANTVWSTLSTRWSTVAKMLTDPDVSAALDAILLPLLAAGLTVEPGEDTPAGRDMAAFIANDLENMSLSLSDFRMAALLGALSDGVSIFEKVWQLGDDRLLHLRKLGERPPRSVASDGWRVDEHGGPAGITQLDDMGNPIELDIDRLLMFIHRRRQGSMVGESILRRIYGPWYIKTELSKLGAVAVERHATGVPTMRPRSRDAGYLDKVDTLLAGLAAGEHSFVRLDMDQEMDDFAVRGLEGAVVSPVDQMEYHRRGIYLGLLCPFLPQGSDGVGSLALSETQSGFFLMMLRAVARLEEDTINRYLIPQWVGYNWPGVDEGALPKARVGRLDRRDVTAWFAAVTAAVQAGVQLDADELKRQAEDMLGLEVPEPEDAAQTGGTDGAGATSPPQDAGSTVPAPAVAPAPVPVAHAGGKRLESEIKFEALGIAPRFAVMAEGLDKAAADIVAKLTPLQRKAATRAAAIAFKAIKDGAPDWAELLALLDIPSDQEQAVILAAMLLLADTGEAEYERELKSQGAKPTAPTAEDHKKRDLLLAGAAMAAGVMLSDRMRQAAVAEATSQALAGLPSLEGMRAVVTAAPDRLLASLATQAAAQALATGRAASAKANAGVVDYEIWTCAMLPTSCEECIKLDGEPFPVGEGPQPPIHQNCQCERVAVVATKPTEPEGD